MNRVEILNKTIELTELVELQGSEFLKLADDETQSKINLANREAELMQSVIDEVNPETNKPRFSNETARDAEFTVRNQKDELLIALRRNANIKGQLRILHANKIDKLKSQISVYKAFLQGSGF